MATAVPTIASPRISEEVALSSTPREVADVSVYFLQDEFMKYLLEVRTGAAALSAASKAPTLPEAETAGEKAATASHDFGIVLLEEAGFTIGLRLVERLILTRARIWEQRECMKFICKDLWGVLFQKQADRLQTNRRGGYVIFDSSLPPLRHVPLPSNYLAHVSGMIRGALTNLGFPCHVIAECGNPPACKNASTALTFFSGSFQVRLK